MSNFSVIVISYNGRDFLKQCLTAVFNNNVKPEQIIVVDDFSSDGTDEMVKKEFGFERLIFIRNQRNLGPTVSRNIGAKRATSPYLIFLDNDVVVKGNSFEKIIGFLEANHRAGVVGAKLIPRGEGKMKWNMGYDPNFLREAVGDLFGFLLKFFPNSGRLYNLTLKFSFNFWIYDEIIEVGWVVECFFALRRDIFEEVGGMDERFFMFGEGPDLCRRIRKAGFGIYFYPEAQADLLQGHMHSKSKRRILFAKFLIIYYLKHYFHFIN